MDNKETNGELEQTDDADPSGQNLDDGETDSKQEENLINVSPPKTPPGPPPPPLKNGGRGQKPPKIPICHQNGKLPKEVEWTEDRGEDRKGSLTLQSRLEHALTDEKQDLLTYLDRHGINSPVKLTPDETGGTSALDILGIIEERDTGTLGSDPSSTMQTMAKPVGFLQRQLWTVLQPSDNRLSMKLFGSKKGLQKEKYRLRKAGVLIIHPCSHFR